MQIITVLIILLLVVSIASIVKVANAQVSDKIYPPDSKPFGLTYGQWSEKWWKWSLGIAMADNPAGDETGERCATSQIDPHVWFLAGTFGGPVTRSCTIPDGKSILIPLINNECSYLEFPAYKTTPELEKCAKDFVDKVSNLQLSIDGVTVPDLTMYRFKSGLYNFTMPQDNVLGLAAGTTDSIADGYWVMLKPLNKGTHEIKFGGSVVDVSTTSNINFATAATYHITIQ